MAPAYYDESDEEPPRSRRPRQAAARPRDDSASRSPSPRPKATARKSAMRDPSQPRKRSNSEVRLNPPAADGNDSDESTNGYWVRHKDGKREFIHDSDPRAADLGARSGGGGRSKSNKVDLEAKNDPRDKKFRERRNGYESDEGETLKAAKPKRKEYDLPYRDRPKGRYDDDDDDGYRGAAAGAAGGAGAAAGAASRRRKDDYDDDRRRPDPKDRRRRYDDDDYEEPRSKPRRPALEKGYDTDAPRQRPRWEDDDRYAERRGGGRRDDPRSKRRSAYDDDPYYSDRREDRRAPERTKSSRYPDDRDRYADRKRRDGDDRRVKEKGKEDGDWKKAAGSMFMTQAMPFIKKEGTKMLQKEMARRFGG